MSSVGVVTVSRSRRARDTSGRYLKDLDMDRANHAATPCEGNARSDESKETMNVNKDRLKPSTSGTMWVMETTGTEWR